jgi:hypothetical protein
MGSVSRTTIAWLAALLGAAFPAFPQDTCGQSAPLLPSRVISPAPTPVPPGLDEAAAARAAELKRWIRDFTEWQKWSAEWSNQREPGLFGGTRERREKPAPPAWLPERCEVLIDEDDPLAHACALLAEWNEDRVAAHLRQSRATTVAKKEDRSKTIWWKYIHADLLWPATDVQSEVFGVAGFHAATTIHGRFQVFVAPGFIVLNLPARNGSRVWKVAANYGIGYRLIDFNLPGGRGAVLHVNVAKAWVVSEASDLVTGRSMDFVGFSITFKER